MKTAWVRGIKDKQAEDDIRASFKSSAVIRARLIEMLAAKEEHKDKATMDEAGYECPNWAYKQADSAGYKRALEEVISLLSK